MKYSIVLLIVIFSNSSFLFAQPAIQWQKSFGGTNNDYATSIQKTNDGGYIIAGVSDSNDSDVSVNNGGSDYWIVKINAAGNIQWEKSFGGTNDDIVNSIQQTLDSGFIVAGSTASNDSDVTGNHGGIDYWIVKLNTAGAIQWQRSLGGTSAEYGCFIQQTADSGYIVAGYSVSNDGDVTGNHGLSDYWIVKLNKAGFIQWQKSLGGTEYESANSIQQTNDGGYIIAGTSDSNDSDVTNNRGGIDCWIVKINASGAIQWQKSFGGTLDDYANSIQQTYDGGYVFAGYTFSNDSDVIGNHGGSDYWIVKLDTAGSIEWKKCLGGTSFDYASYIQQTYDGGYIIAGNSRSNDGDVTGNHGLRDYWIVKLLPNGSIEWQKSLGSSYYDEATSIKPTTDGGFVIAGRAPFNDGDVTGNHGGDDYWIVKLSSYTTNDIVVQKLLSNIQIIPNPFSNITTLSFQLSSSNKVNIEIRDIEGRLIKNLSSKYFNNGNNEVIWDATNNSGSKVDNGLYFITLTSDNFSETKKVVVLRD